MTPKSTGSNDPAPAHDELGAHVSSAGGPQNAPARAAEIDSVCLQLFTKQPSRWAERDFDGDVASAWSDAREVHGVRFAAAHDSYLINLATPDPELFRRSVDSFRRELGRCAALELSALVTHPGNATDGDPARGLAQNADAIGEALEAVPGPTVVLIETTAGSGSVLGATFEEIAGLLERMPASLHHRVGVCFDTCHVHAAGYDLVDDYDGVMSRFDDTVGLDRIGLFHLNDSATPFASRRDRHAHVGEGSLGDTPFRRLLTDDRFTAVPKLLETPKDDDAVAADRRNLRRLRNFRA